MYVTSVDYTQKMYSVEITVWFWHARYFQLHRFGASNDSTNV